MRASRLELALDSGAWVLPPAGDIAVYRPHRGDDLSALPQSRTVMLTGFRPDHDHFTGLGYRTAAPSFTTALVCLPRAKADAQALMAEAAAALPAGAIIAVDGQKTDGIDPLLKDCRALGLQVSDTLSKAHGKFATVTSAPALQQWAAQDHRTEGFITRPGTFSADGPDRGSTLLAEALPPDLPARIADLGAGWGFLSRAILTRPGVRHLDVIEADQTALTCARRNLHDPRAAFHWADATRFRPDRPWNAVVMNPPFHSGREADPSLGLAFIRAAHKGLTPDGSLWMVANRHLPYDKTLHDLFRDITDLTRDPAFRVIRAAYPIRHK